MIFESLNKFQEWLTENDLKLSDVDINEKVHTSGYAHVDGDLTLSPSTITTTTTTDGSGIISVSDGTISTTDGTFTIHSGSNVTESIEPKNIAIKSLSVQPEIKQVPLSESEGSNIWYVDEYESIEDGCCGTSKIVYKGSTMLMNVCESEGESTVTLIVEVDGDIARVPFKLDESCNNTSKYDMILSI